MDSNNTSRTLDDIDLSLSPGEVWTLGIMGVATWATGVFGNILILCVLFTQPLLRSQKPGSAHNIFIGNLAVADLFITGYGVPYWVVDVATGVHPTVSRTHCQVNGYLGLVCSVCSIGSLWAISCNRYLSICHHTTYRRLAVTRNKVLWLCLALWLGSALICSVPFFGPGTFTYDRRSRSCFLDRRDSNTKSYVLVTVPAMAALVCIGVFNGAIFRHWHQNKKRLRQWRQQASKKDADITEDTNTIQNSRNISTAQHSKNRRTDSDTRLAAETEEANSGLNSDDDTDDFEDDGNMKNRVKIIENSPADIVKVDLEPNSRTRKERRGNTVSNSELTLSTNNLVKHKPRRGLSEDLLEVNCADKNEDMPRSLLSDAEDEDGIFVVEQNQCTSQRNDTTSLQREPVCGIAIVGFSQGAITHHNQSTCQSDNNESNSGPQGDPPCLFAKKGFSLGTRVRNKNRFTLLNAFSKRFSSLNSRNEKTDSQTQNNRAMVRSLFAVYVCLIVLYFTALFVGVLEVLVYVPAFVSVFSNLMFFVNSSINWLLYGYFNKTFRAGYSQMLASCRRKVKVGVVNTTSV